MIQYHVRDGETIILLKEFSFYSENYNTSADKN